MEELARQDGIGSLIRQQVSPVPRLLLLLLRLRRRPRVYRFPVIPSKDRRDRRKQKRAVEARLGDGEMEGEEEGTEILGIIGTVYGKGGGKEPERSIIKIILENFKVKRKVKRPENVKESVPDAK